MIPWCALLSAFICFSAALSPEQVREPLKNSGQLHEHHRHHHHHREKSGAPDRASALSISDAGIMRREEDGDASDGQDSAVKSYATTATPRPALLLQAEPHVSCGKHVASECSACVLTHGPDWCHGDCRWDEDESICKWNAETTKLTSTTDKYPGVDESAMSDDAIAAKLRKEQEVAETEEKDSKNKFWATVGISAAISSLLVMTCGVVAICVCFRSPAKKKEEALIQEGADEAEDNSEDVAADIDNENSDEGAATPYAP